MSANIPINPAVAPSTEHAGETPAPRRGTGETFWEQIGGEPTFRQIVHRFYEQVGQDPQFREMYPEEDLGPAEDRLRWFLEQYWGGPATYSENRGHPRLRMRHNPFPVTPAARDTWLRFMRVALDEANLPPLHYATFWDYLERAAHSLVNTFEDPQ